MRALERHILLQIIDTRWKEHLARDGLPARGHPPPRLRPDRSAGRVQERGLHHVPGPHGLDLGGVRAPDLPRRRRDPARQVEEAFGPDGDPSDVDYSGGTEDRAALGARRGPRGGRRSGDRRGAAAAAAAAGTTAATAPATAAPTRPRWSRARTRRSAATIPAGADPARSTRSATAPDGRDAARRHRSARGLRGQPRRCSRSLRPPRGQPVAPPGVAGVAVTISGRAYAFNHMSTYLSGATIKVREIPGLSATTDAERRLRARGSRRHERHPVHRPARRLQPDRPADVPHPRRGHRERQLPDAGRRRVRALAAHPRGPARRGRPARRSA